MKINTYLQVALVACLAVFAAALSGCANIPTKAEIQASIDQAQVVVDGLQDEKAEYIALIETLPLDDEQRQSTADKIAQVDASIDYWQGRAAELSEFMAQIPEDTDSPLFWLGLGAEGAKFLGPWGVLAGTAIGSAIAVWRRSREQVNGALKYAKATEFNYAGDMRHISIVDTPTVLDSYINSPDPVVSAATAKLAAELNGGGRD